MSAKEVEELKPDFIKVGKDIEGADGPTFNADGEFFLIAPYFEDGTSAIVKVDLDNGETTEWYKPEFDGTPGVPASCRCDRDNNVWVADMRHGILKVTPDGKAKQMVKQCNGQPMQGCNDCVFDSKGNVYITAPAGPIAPAPYVRSNEKPYGTLYCLKEDGKISKLDTGIFYGYGLAVSSDEKLLIVAQSHRRNLLAYDIVGSGVVDNKREWATVPGSGHNGPDGMDFDSEGNLLVANWGDSHIEVYNSSGEHIYRIKCPFVHPCNLQFKPNSNRVYVTAHQDHGLWHFDWLHKGRKHRMA